MIAPEPGSSRASLGAVIAAQLHEWGGAALPLEQQVFGTSEPDAIAAAVDRWCEHNLGSRVAKYHFFDSSSGSVHGVRLTDGRDVVVKVHRPDLTFVYLDAVIRVQRSFAEHGIPAPTPLAGPTPFGAAHVTAESMLGRGPRADAHDPVVRGALAAGLARFAAVGRAISVESTDALTHPASMPADALYPPPHSPRFDFDKTAAGSEWIDAFARRARRVIAAGDPGPDVLMHGDWRIENVNVADGEVVAIFDWDSVCREPEMYAVATAITTFPVDWNRPVGEHFPTNAEMRAFLTEYEAARGARFDDGQRRMIAARVVYSLCYGARCERADGHPAVADSQQGLLHRLGEPLLVHGFAALDD